jgi:hypothetical protein
MKKIYLLIGLFLWIQFGFAQKTTYEFFGGVAFSSVIGGSGYNSDGSQEFQTGDHIGYVNRFSMKNCDAVELGIFFNKIGCKIIHFLLESHNIAVPLKILFGFH